MLSSDDTHMHGTWVPIDIYRHAHKIKKCNVIFKRTFSDVSVKQDPNGPT